MPRTGTSGGFTLLEILVALVIAAVGIAAVAQTVATSIRVAQESETRLFAGWVASNRMAQLRLERRTVISGDHSSEVRMGGRDWYLAESYTDTADPRIKRVDISVYSDRNHTDFAVALFGYLAAYRPAVQMQ